MHMVHPYKKLEMCANKLYTMHHLKRAFLTLQIHDAVEMPKEVFFLRFEFKHHINKYKAYLNKIKTVMSNISTIYPWQ